MSERLSVIRTLREREFVSALVDAAVGDHRGAIAEIGAWFKPEWIYDPFHREITISLLALVRADRPITASCIAMAFTGQAKRFAMMLSQVVDVIQNRYGWAHLSYFARCVYDEHRRFSVADDLHGEASHLEEGEDVDVTLASVSSLPQKYVAMAAQRGVDNAGAVDEIIEELDGKRVTRFYTGLAGLDYLTLGFAEGSLVVFAAHTSCGKSAILGQLALEAVMKHDMHVLFFAAELTTKQMAERWASYITGVTPNDRRNYIGGLAQLKPLLARGGKLQVFPGTRHIDQLVREVHAYQSVHQVQMVVVDYLQLYRGGSKNDTRERQVADVTSKLKELAVELKIPVLTASQINRAAQGQPKLSNLRESGAIEQDADVVILLAPDDMDATPVEVSVAVAKNRQGTTGLTRIRWDKRTYRMVDADPRTASSQGLF